ncbi:hypothetical protein IG631_19848 [Alternaria alternata]|nr:hypothetical protein IG631_19848 [Alternaria alternata]
MRFTNGHPAGRTTNNYDAWPFVELVSTGGPFAVLERNIILADTPGLDDISLLAETSILGYLPRCTTVIIAHKIDRISSTSSLRQMIRARRGRPVAVVATCSRSRILLVLTRTSLSKLTKSCGLVRGSSGVKASSCAMQYPLSTYR